MKKNKCMKSMSLLGEQLIFFGHLLYTNTLGPTSLAHVLKGTQEHAHTYAHKQPVSNIALMIAYLSKWKRKLKYNA